MKRLEKAQRGSAAKSVSLVTIAEKNTYEVVIRNSNHNCYTCFYILLVAFPPPRFWLTIWVCRLYIDHADYSCKKQVMFFTSGPISNQYESFI